MPASHITEDDNIATLTPMYQTGPYTISGLFAGATVGCTELLISYPIELCKTQLQLDREGKPGKFIGVSDVIHRSIKKKGFLSLYQGMGVVMLFTAPQESVRFGVYEELKSLSKDQEGRLTLLKVFYCGLVAGICEAIVAVTPMETIKVKLIHDQRAENPRYTGFFLTSTLKLIKHEGIRGVYQGLFPTILKQGTNQGIRFCMVEALKREYKNRNSTEKVPSPVVGVFGVIAGLTSVFMNNPIDVVKTRLQGLHGREYKTTFNCFKRIYTEEGFKAFYKGTRARCLRVGIDVGYTFMFYDIVKESIMAFVTKT